MQIFWVYDFDRLSGKRQFASSLVTEWSMSGVFFKRYRVYHDFCLEVVPRQIFEIRGGTGTKNK